MEESKKYYIRSNGEKIDVETMNTEHVINGLAKKYREIFESQNKQEYYKHIEQINVLKEDLYRRFNNFEAELGEK